MHRELNIEEKDIIIQQYDYIFCGTGASASLLLLQLHQNKLLQNLNILLIDPDKKERRDKTFCFWADKEDPITVDLKPIISHHWDKLALSGETIHDISPLQYNHVSSIDLYNQIHQLTVQYNWRKIIGCVEKIKSDSEGPFIFLNGSILRAKYIFDSRPPQFKLVQDRETHIFQSFVGWIIETESEIKDSTAFRFMDFQVEQQNSTQFVYVLPFSKNSALVEVTRFGAEIIDRTAAEELLEIYVKTHFGKYAIQDIEMGCIPMSNAEITHTELPGIVLLGARNYQIKPSTGYAFKNMYHHAREIVEALKEKQSIDALNKTKVETRKSRFSFYDALLLDILKNKPKKGKPIFETLLKNVEIKKILRFLDEKTDFITDLSILSKLPWNIFISTLIRRSFSLNWFRPLILTLITILLLLLSEYSAIQGYVANTLIFIGLIAVGIPHGAVDHLLETGSWDVKKAPLFIIKYLCLALIMGVLWYAFPLIALIVFLAYSSWHFGQADGKNWSLPAFSSTIWGASVLFHILGSHLSETNAILSAMGNLALPISSPQWLLLPWLIVAILRKKTAFILTIFWLLLSTKLPLLISFGIYFLGQHSLTGWYDLKNHLKLSNSKLWMKSLPFHSAAWIFLTCFLFFWTSSYPFDETKRSAAFFIFIACISFPHAIYMNFVYNSKK